MENNLPVRGESLDDLRAHIHALEQRTGSNEQAVVPFGVPDIDLRLPHGGLPLGALHEIAPGGSELTPRGGGGPLRGWHSGARRRPVLWCLRGRRGVFAPSLAGVGLSPDRVLYAEAENGDASVLAILEEGLAHAALAGVVGEVKRLSLTAARRLQLAGERTGVAAFVLRRWSGGHDAEEPTAALSRWRLTTLPSSPLPTAGIGRPRWRVELVRCRGGAPAQWIVEACDAKGTLRVPADVADGQGATDAGRRAAAG